MKVRSIKEIREQKKKESKKQKKISPLLKEEVDKYYEIKEYLSFMKPFSAPCHKESVIPCHLYTCWHTKELPPLMKKNYEMIVRNNPEIQVHLYDANECRAFIKLHFDQSVVNAYDTLVPCSYKSDLWRYCVLHTNGGIYMDIKYKLMNDFRFIELTDKEYFVRDAVPTNVYTALIVTMPGNPILLQCIHQIVENVKTKYYGTCSLTPTGPALLGSFFTIKEKKDMVLHHDHKDTINKFYIVFQNRIILEFYENYREEQVMYQKNKRYLYLWNENAIYR